MKNRKEIKEKFLSLSNVYIKKGEIGAFHPDNEANEKRTKETFAGLLGYLMQCKQGEFYSKKAQGYTYDTNEKRAVVMKEIGNYMAEKKLSPKTTPPL